MPDPTDKEWTAGEVLRLMARAETAEASQGAVLDALEGVVRVVNRVGGFMSHDDQLRLRGAKAVLAEHGRSVE